MTVDPLNYFLKEFPLKLLRRDLLSLETEFWGTKFRENIIHFLWLGNGIVISVTRWLDVKYFAVYNSENLPNSIKNLPKKVQNCAKH